MAFIKKDWKCGDTITADDLNRLENGVEEALDGGSVDCGYSCTEERVTLTDESVTTTLGEENYAEGRLSYSSEINADTIKVTFNGAEYTCQKDGYGAYGAHWNNEARAYDWSEYPFVIYWLSEFTQNYLDTETAGTYQVKIEEPSIEADVTECFKKAAIHATKEAMKEVLQPLVLIHNSASTLSATFETIRDAYLAGRSVLLDPIVNSKSYYSMVSLVLTDYLDPTAGGEIVFGGETTQTFTASTASDYPTKVTS